MGIGKYWRVTAGVALATLIGCSSEPLKGGGSLGTQAAPSGDSVSDTANADDVRAGRLALNQFGASNANTHVDHALEAGANVLAISGTGPLEVSGPSFTSNQLGNALSVDVRPPTLSSNPAWTGELQVFVSDPHTLGGKRYVGGYSLTPLPRGLTSRIQIPIHPSLKPLFQNGGQVSFVLQVPDKSAPFFVSRVALDAVEVKSALPSTVTLHLLLPKGASFANTALLGAAGVDIRDSVAISGAAGLTVASGATTALGADSVLSGNVLSNGTVSLAERASIQGNLTTSAGFTHQTTYTVAGTLQTQTSLSPLFDQALTVEYPASTTALNLEPDQVRAVTAGAFTTLNLKSRSKLTLSPGDYFFDSATLEPLTELRVTDPTQPVVLHVKDQLTFRGSLPNAQASNVLWIVSGTSAVEIGAPLVGTLIAPNADVHLAPTSGVTHRGAVFGKSVIVEAHSPFQLVPFSGWDQLLRPTVASDASPSATFRARWVYPNGAPIVSFSYAPSTGLHALALGQPGEVPTTALNFQVQNLSPAVGGIPVAYSVVMKTWGLGNQAFDVTLRTADASHVLAPGGLDTVAIPNLPDVLGVKATDMPAKGDVIVSLFRLSGSGIEATPFAFLRMPQFFYHFSDDLTKVFVYSLERASQQLAPSGMSPVDGVVERYAQGVFHADLFAPNGMLGTITAAQARANLLTQFATHSAQLYGIRWDATAAGTTPSNVIPPGATVGAVNAPFNPSDGPTGICVTWPTVFVDNGDEPFPPRSQDSFKNIVDFLPAAFDHVQLFRADGTLITDEHLDKNGCFADKKQLGKGNYLVRVFSTGIDNNSGVRFNVTRFEPPQVDGSDKDVSVTYAVFLNLPGHTAPAGDTFTVTTGMWTETTHLAGFASHLLARDANGIDFGLTRGTAAAPKVYPIVANTATISHFDGNRLNINESLSENSWVTDARWKFVLAHEFGHMVQGFAGQGLPARYTFNGNDSSSDRTLAKEPASAQPVAHDCTCNLIEAGDNQLHCLQSIEISASAQQEAFGHFMATRVWNRSPGDPGYDGSCHFTYYKQVGSTELVASPVLPPVSIDCAKAYQHRKLACGAVNITLDGLPTEAASEIDWLTFFRALTSDATHPVNVHDILTWYGNACGANCSSTFVTYANFHDGAPPAIQSFVDGLAVIHGLK